MARWSGVGEPDDPLRADDALVGSDHEDVLSGTAAVGDAEPDVPYADPAPSAADEVLTSVAPMYDQPTMEMPAVVVAAPEPEPRGRLGMVAPWVVFAAVAVVVLAATSTLASVLQGPRSERQSFTGLLQVPTPTATAPAPAAAPPTSAPAAEPTPEPEKKPEPAARPTKRPKATRAPAPRPRAGAVGAPTTSEKKKPVQSPPTTGGTGSGAAAAGETGDTADGAAKDDAAKDAAKGGAAKGDTSEDGATASGEDSGDSEDEGD